jgi:hypothetical protein
VGDMAMAIKRKELELEGIATSKLALWKVSDSLPLVRLRLMSTINLCEVSIPDELNDKDATGYG